MVSTRNTTRSHANPPRMQNQPGGVDSRPPGGTLETVQVNINEVEVLHFTNQHLLKELEQLTRQIQRPQQTRQTRKDQNTFTREEKNLDPRREVDREGETSHTREHDPYQPPREDRNEERHGRNNKGDGPLLYQLETEERSWEQRFRDIQQEISHMKEVVKGRASVSMDTLVQQTESLFTVGVLHFPLPAKFIMP